MQRSYKPGMLSVLGAFLALGVGCRDGGTTPPTGTDLSTPPTGDMRMPDDVDGGPPPAEATIRDINELKFKHGDRVHLTGVVTSPKPWTVAQGRDCYFFIYVGQPDATPTVKDGLRVAYEKFSSGDMAGSDSYCRSDASGGPPEMMKVMVGNKIDITGRVEITAVRRQVLVTSMTGIKDMGPSNEPVKPVEVNPMDYPRPAMGGTPAASFKDNQGALVRFTNVVTSARRTAFPFDFNVAPAAGGTASGIDTSYLWTIDPMTGRAADYVTPMDGAAYNTVTGIVSIDFYKIWVRSPQDLVPKM
jgi:hypothetical protein